MSKILKYSTVIVAILIGFFTLESCDKKIKINATWKDVTVVFGLLDKNELTHYIKINKTFLGEANAFDMAQVRDSSEYKNLVAVVEEWKEGKLSNTFPLVSETITGRKEGTFYGPDQTVYKFDAILDSSASYKLVATINDKEVTAETEIIDGIQLKNFGASKSLISFANTTTFVDPIIAISPLKDSKRFEIYAIFKYFDVFDKGNNDTSMVAHEEKILLGQYRTGTANGVGEGEPSFDIKMSSETFFREIGSRVPKAEETPTLIKRIIGNMELLVVAGGDDLNTYMDVASPSSGIVEDKKEFTNVENGIGIFSCRTSESYTKELSRITIKELMTSEISAAETNTEGYTFGRKFCDPYISNTQCAACFPAEGVNPCH